MSIRIIPLVVAAAIAIALVAAPAGAQFFSPFGTGIGYTAQSSYTVASGFGYSTGFGFPGTFGFCGFGFPTAFANSFGFSTGFGTESVAIGGFPFAMW